MLSSLRTASIFRSAILRVEAKPRRVLSARSLNQKASGSQSQAIEQKGPRSAYVHLPFCKRKCLYCDFAVLALGSAPDETNLARFSRYTELLLQEILHTPCSSPAGLDTIFFGGGTPSLLPPQLLSQLLDSLRSKFGIAVDAEISMEADPGTFTADTLAAYMHSGVNRFSVGIQAFQQEHLERCGRSHGLQDVVEAVRVMQQAAPASWSLDLISGLPHLRMADWQQSLEAAIAAQPPHISTYGLEVEDNTPFASLYQPGEKPLPEDTEAADMYRLASSLLSKAGYEHYEVSSYALPGHRCRHNQVYWGGAPFYAFGMSAASYQDERRVTRPRSMKGYEQWVKVLSGGQDPAAALEADSPLDQLLDVIMLSLRTSDGLDMLRVEQRFGQASRSTVEAAVRKHVDQGLVSYCQPSVIRLTDPEGFLIENDIVSDIFAAVSRKVKSPAAATVEIRK